MEYKGKGDNFKNMELKVRRGINIRIQIIKGERGIQNKTKTNNYEVLRKMNHNTYF